MSGIPAAYPESRNRIFLRLGLNGALGADEVQWVLYHLVHTDKPRAGSAWQGVQWKAVSYVRSTKRILARCIREKGIDLSQEGQAALDALADDFDSWKADPGRRGTPVAPLPQMPLYGAKNQTLRPSESRGRGPVPIAMVERLGPGCALGTDGRQWIVYRAMAGGARITWQGKQWEAVGYIHSDKRTLVACIESKGLKLSAAGREALELQYAKIYGWRTCTEKQAGAIPERHRTGEFGDQVGVGGIRVAANTLSTEMSLSGAENETLRHVTEPNIAKLRQRERDGYGRLAQWRL